MHMQISAKNPDIGKTPIKRMHHGGFVNLSLSTIVKKYIFYEMTVTSTECNHQKINM